MKKTQILIFIMFLLGCIFAKSLNKNHNIVERRLKKHTQVVASEEA